MDVLLANSYHMIHDRKGERIEGPYAPLGPLYLAAVLRERGFDVGYFDGTFSKGYHEFEEVVKRERPACVGVYNTVISRASAAAMIAIAKKHGVPVVSGGPDPSATPDTYLDLGADAVGVGEAEMTAPEIVEAFRGERDLGSVAGLRYWKDGEKAATIPRARIDDLDSLPFPARDLLDWQKYAAATRKFHGKSQLTVMTARGCPFECTWCCKPIFGRKYRHRSAESVAREFEHVKETYAPDSIRIADDVFTIAKKRAVETCDAIVARGAEIPFECLTRVDLVDAPTIEALRRAKCWRIYYGVESGSQRVLDSMKKGITIEQVDRASALTRGAGIEQYWFLMYAYPPEDVPDILATLGLLRRHLPEAWGITVSYPLPQTEFYDLVSERMDGQMVAWEKTRDNKVMWDTEFGSAYYRACVYAAHAVYRAGRLAEGSPNAATRALDRAVGASAELGVRALARVMRRRRRATKREGAAPPAAPPEKPARAPAIPLGLRAGK